MIFEEQDNLVSARKYLTMSLALFEKTGDDENADILRGHLKEIIRVY